MATATAPDSPNRPTRPTGSAARWSVRAYLLCLALACLVPGLIGAALLLFHGYQTERTQLEKNSLQTARALVQTVDSHLLRAQAIAASLSTAGSVYKGHFADFHRRALELSALAAPGTHFVLSTPSGEQLVNSQYQFGTALPRYGDLDQLHHIAKTGKSAISNLYVETTSQRPVVSIAVPVTINGKVTYVLSICIRPEHFSSILQAQSLPSDWLAAIFDASGTIVARTRAQEQFVGRKPSATLFRRLKESAEDVIDTVTPDGVPVLSIYSRSQLTGWSVGFGIPRQSLELQYKRPIIMLALGMAVLFAIGLGLARFMGSRIARSVHALSGPALALGRGVTAPVPTVHIKEVAEVANAMGEAAALLQESTSALQETNQLLLAKKSELDEAHRLAKFATWHWNLKTGEFTGSASLHKIFGRTHLPTFAEMKGTLLTVDSWERVNSASRDVVRTGIGYDVEVQLIHASGATIWANLKCEAVRDDNDQIVAVRGTLQDISERKAAEAALAAEREAHQLHLERQVAERTAALTTANLELERLARQDALTGLQNRLSASERLRAEFLRLKRTGRAYAALLLDIDHFKRINDTYGHETGDHVLQQVAAILADTVRTTDFVARFGGEEFLVLLPETDTVGAVTSAEKIRKAIAEHPFPSVGRVTLSIGVACASNADNNADEAIRRADEALYRSKEEGRNKVSAA